MGNTISSGSNRASTRAGSMGYLQTFFLDRLGRMVGVRRERSHTYTAGSVDLRLLDKAVYSTFCDCLDLDVGEEARTILRQAGFGRTVEDGEESGSN